MRVSAHFGDVALLLHDPVLLAEPPQLRALSRRQVQLTGTAPTVMLSDFDDDLAFGTSSINVGQSLLHLF